MKTFTLRRKAMLTSLTVGLKKYIVILSESFSRAI